VARRKKPQFEQASVSLNLLASSPKTQKKSALATFVEQDFVKLIAAIEQGHPLGAICQLLSQPGISATPKQLRSALYAFAVEHDRLSELPSQILPDPAVATTSQPETSSLQPELEVIPEAEAKETGSQLSGARMNRDRVPPQ
jgi:hypothetical protein